MGKDVKIIQEFPSRSPVRALPTVTIGGKPYFRDDRLEEFRRVDRPGDRPIKFEELGAYASGEEVRAIFGPREAPLPASRQLRRDVEIGKIIIDKEGVIRCPRCNRNYNDYLAEFEKKGGSSCDSCWAIWDRNYNDYLAEFEKKGGSSCDSCWAIWG